MQGTSNSNIIGKKVILKRIDKFFTGKDTIKLQGKRPVLKNNGKKLVIVTKNSTIPLNDFTYLTYNRQHGASSSSIKLESNLNECITSIVNTCRKETKDFACQVYIPDDKIRHEKECQTEYLEEKNNVLCNLYPEDGLYNIPKLTEETIEYYLNDPPFIEGSLDNFMNQCITDSYSNQFSYNKKVIPQQQMPIYKYMYTCYMKCDVYDEEGYLPIHHAVEQNDVEEIKRQSVVLKLKRDTIDIETTNTFYTPLQMAILNKSSIVVLETLLECNSSLEPQDNDGNSIIHLAVHCNEDGLEKILNYAETIKFDIDQYNFEGITPLMVAVINENIDKINILLKSGADPNVTDQKSGKTALFYAIERDEGEIVQMLLQFGADTNISNFFGMNCRDVVFELEGVSKDIQDLIKSNSKVKKYIKATKSKIRRASKKRRP